MSASRRTRFPQSPFLALLTATLVAFPPYGQEDVSAAQGDLDTAFGRFGQIVIPTGTSGMNVYDMALHPNGRIVVVGGTSTRGGGDASVDFAVLRLTTSGYPDPSFGVGGLVRSDFDNGSESAVGVVIQPDGRIVVAGNATSQTPEGHSGAILVRYNADGTFDGTFGADGKVLLPFPARASALLRQPDGTIVVGGVDDVDTPDRIDFALTRVYADGSLDTSFGVDGRITTAFGSASSDDALRALELQADGRIVALGLRDLGAAFLLARYRPDGSLDPDFGTDGKVATSISNHSGEVHDLGIQPDGRIVAIGSAFRWPSGTPKFYVQRYTADGVLDPSFDGDGRLMVETEGTVSRAFSVAIDGAGRIVLGGQVSDTGRNDYFGVTRLSADGTLDTSFGSGGWATAHFAPSDWLRCVLVQRDGKIVVAGEANVTASGSDLALARFDGGIPHASVFYPRAVDAPPATSGLVMTPVPPAPQPLTVSAPAVTWLSETAVTGTFPLDGGQVPRRATFRFVTPCTQASGRGKTVQLVSTNPDGGDEQPLGTGQSTGSCGRTEVIDIPVDGEIMLTNRRLKLTVTAPGGVHLQLGPRTFLSALAFNQGQ